MSFYRNPDSKTYEADIRDRVIPRVRLSLGTSNKAEATRRHVALERLVREGHVDLVDRLRARTLNIEAVARVAQTGQPFDVLRSDAAWPSVEAAGETYASWLDEHRAKSTAVQARTQIKRFVAFAAVHLGVAPEAVMVGAVTPALADAYRAELVRVAKPNTATAYFGRMIALYRWLQRQEERAVRGTARLPRRLELPFDVETRPTGKTHRERFLTPEEAERLLAAAPAALRLPIALGLWGGLRIGETLHLRAGVDVDLERAMLIVQSREGDAPHAWSTKRGKRREVPINADLAPIVATAAAALADGDYIVSRTGARHRPWDATGFHAEFRRVVLAAALIPGAAHPMGVTYHTLRHTFASWLMQRDINPVRIAKLLGNSLQMVLDVYGHLQPADNRMAVEALAGIVTGIVPGEVRSELRSEARAPSLPQPVPQPEAR